MSEHNIPDTNDGYLMHIGTKTSGRYPRGSGMFPYQHEPWFKGFGRGNKYAGGSLADQVSSLRKQGMSEIDIAKGFGISTNELRKELSREKTALGSDRYAKTLELQKAGKNNSEIARELGISEGSVRNMLKKAENLSVLKTNKTADILKKQVDEKGMVDIGPGVEISLGVTDTRLENAASILEKQGYNIHNVYIDQLGGQKGQKQVIRVLAKGDIDYQQARENYADIRTIEDYSLDGGAVWAVKAPVKSISSDRIMIRYNEEGGVDKDGVIEIRPGVKDLDLGNSHYAQVRIGVDDTHYMKGMAVYDYNNDMPKGIDIIYNSNKHVGTDKMKCLKPMAETTPGSGIIDKENPFSASIKPEADLKRVPRYYIDENGEKKVSPINVVNEEGDWSQWSKNLSPQFLSKQQLQTVKRQLNLTYADKEKEFRELSELTNPAVKKKLLQEFADDVDKSAEHLKAMQYPKQQTHVLMPLTDIPENQIYAPNYKDGEQVALLRFPHSGPEQIPVLTVNNSIKSAKTVLGNAPDAVGIHHSVATILAGADYDGDTVVAFPVGKGTTVLSKEPFKSLKDFEPKEVYTEVPGMKYMTKKQTQQEMGKITNLIADMGLQGAPSEDMEKAIRHSLVVIDAEKHKLNYKQSEKDNDIAALKAKYQKKEDGGSGGASTLITRAGSEYWVTDRKRAYHDDPVTGEKVYIEKQPKTVINKNGEEVVINPKKIKSTKMAEVKDARELLSGYSEKTKDLDAAVENSHPVEVAYADYANRCKQLANRARLEAMNTERMTLSPSAKKVYSNEVESLERKLRVAKMNAPRERQAQIVGNVIANERISRNPDLDNEHIQRIKQQELGRARAKFGAKKQRIDITENEWKAIQAGAISQNKLDDILSNSDMDMIRKLATPRKGGRTLTNSDMSYIKSLSSRGWTIADIAAKFGVSNSTIQRALV